MHQAEKRWDTERCQSIGDCARDGPNPSNGAALAGPLHPQGIERGRAAHAPATNVRQVSLPRT
jgi:hypothetical protein